MTIRIGIVGCGRILAAHLRGYRLLREAGFDQFRVTALCARRAADAQGYAVRGQGPPQRGAVSDRPGDPLAVRDQYVSDFQEEPPAIFTDFREMIAGDVVDAVNDFTTHELHHTVAAECFAAGKHLLTQKPLAVSVAAARAMCRQAEAAGAVFGVFENARNRPATRHLRWLIDNGRLGRLKMIQLANIGNWWAPDLVVAETPWRHRREAGGGLTLDIGVHLFHQFAYLAGDVTRVWGQASVQEPRRRMVEADISCDADDTVIAGFQTRDGVHGSLHLSWSGHGEPTMSGAGRGPCYYFERGSVIGDDLQDDSGERISLSQLYDAEVDADQRQRHFPHGLTDAFALNQLDWLRAIEADQAPETSGDAGTRDLAAAVAILESSASGRQVAVDDVLQGAVRDWQRPIDQRHGIG